MVRNPVACYQEPVGVDHVRRTSEHGCQIFALFNLQLFNLTRLNDFNLIHLVGQDLAQVVDVEDISLFHFRKQAGVGVQFLVHLFPSLIFT